MPSSTPQRVTIIGAGLAGACVAHSLAQRGIQIELLEKAEGIATGASGNRVGVLFPRLAATLDQETLFYLSGMAYTKSWLQSLGANAQKLFDSPGIIWCENQHRDAKRFDQLTKEINNPALMRRINKSEASKLAGIEIKKGGIFIPGGTWIKTSELCAHLLTHPNITVTYNAEIESLQFENNEWQICATNGATWQSAICVLANAQAITKLAPTAWLELANVRGQVTQIPSAPPLSNLQTILCGNAYVTPSINNQHDIGATFEPDNHSTEITNSAHQDNLERAQTMLNLPTTPTKLEGRASHRTVTADLFPCVGQVPDYQFFNENYEDLHHGRTDQEFPAPRYLSQLYVTTAHGARGLISCPIGGELIAAQICGEPLPINSQIVEKLNPARQIISKLRRPPALR